jgi:hypothetical protein
MGVCFGIVVEPDPFRGARMPAGRREGLSGRLPVIGDQRGALVELGGVESFEHVRHAGVCAPAVFP